MRSLNILYSCPIDLVIFAAPGQHVTNVSHELALRGHRISLVHPGSSLTNIRPIKQYPLFLKKGKWTGRLSTDIKYAISLFKLIRKNNYDVVYHRLEKWSVIPLIIFKLQRVPVLLEFNAENRTELASLDTPLLARRLYPLSEYLQVFLATKIIVVSEGIGQTLLRNNSLAKNKTFIIENGADTNLFFPRNRNLACKSLNLDPSKRYIAFSGSFQPWQGLDTLMNTVVGVLSKVPDAHFLLIGDGRERITVEKLIKKNNIDTAVTITGWLEPNEVANYLAASDVCVAPYSAQAALDPQSIDTDWKTSLMKCSPLKIFTYMAMGKPVVAGGFKDGGERLERSGTGLSFKPGSSSELAASIVKILTNKSLGYQLGARAAEHVRKNHTWSEVAKNIDKNCLQQLA